MDDAVKRFRLRRQRRLDARRYRRDAPEDETNEKNEKSGGKKGGGGRGNTKLPFGLCRRFGIEVKTGWTPRDAWDALAGKGYTPEEVYKELKTTGKVSEKKVEPKKEPKKGRKTGPRWLGTGKQEYIEHHGVKYGKPTANKSKYDNTYTVTALDKDRHEFKRRFSGKNSLMLFLKNKGVEKATVDGEEVNPQEVELPKVIGKVNDTPMQEISARFVVHRNPEDRPGDRPKPPSARVEIYGKDLDGNERLLYRSAEIEDLTEGSLKKKVADCTESFGGKHGIEVGDMKMPDASEAMKKSKEIRDSDEKYYQERKKWERENPEEARREQMGRGYRRNWLSDD